VPQIEVTFQIDADGVVNVSAKDLGTGKSQAIRVTASSGLDEQEIDRLVGEAEENVAADNARRERVDLTNKADGLIYSTERTLEEFADNICDEDRETLLESIALTKGLMDKDEVAELRDAVDELSALTYQMTEKLYAELGGADE
jgi:molecular chaperone DnaK